MDIHSLTSAHLKRAINLLAKKEALQKQLSTLDSQISSLLGGREATPRKAAAPGTKAIKGRAKKGRRRGDLKQSILAELRQAGLEGVTVKNLVQKLGSKSANIHAWFNMTGKNVPGLTKTGRGMYRLEE